MPLHATMTAEQFDALPEEEGRKWELLDGELIEVSSATPRQNLIVAHLLTRLDVFAEAKSIGTPLFRTDLAVRANTRLRPDIGFFSADTWRTVDIDVVPVTQIPDIAVAIISPSETATTINRKVDAYLKWGVQEVWLIEPEIRTLFVHTLTGAQRLSEGAFLTSEFVPGWRLQIADLFENL
jgi:Uma2 family endonuclease